MSPSCLTAVRGFAWYRLGIRFNGPASFLREEGKTPLSAIDRRKRTRAAGLIAFAAVVIPSIGSGQEVSLKTLPGAEVGVNAAYYKYHEPDLAVTEKGYNAGIDLAYTAIRGNNWFVRGDASFAYGHNDYTGSGTKDDNPYRYAEVRGTLGKDFEKDGYTLSPYAGIGFRYSRDDLRGLTSTGAGGYRRESQYLYIPLGMTHRIGLKASARLSTTLEFDYFLQGRQKSYLSDVSPSLPDLTNDQNKGYGFRGSVYYEKGNWSIGPWFHYWHIDQSELAAATVIVSGMPVTTFFVEPKNTTTEFGIRFGYRF